MQINIATGDAVIHAVQNGNYDIVFADENMRGLVPGSKGTFVNVRHFAVSGKLQES